MSYIEITAKDKEAAKILRELSLGGNKQVKLTFREESKTLKMELKGVLGKVAKAQWKNLAKSYLSLIDDTMEEKGCEKNDYEVVIHD